MVLTVDLFRVPSLSQRPIEWLSWPLASKVRQAGPSGHLNQRSCGQWQQKGTGSHWSDLVRCPALASSNHLGPQNIILAFPWKMILTSWPQKVSNIKNSYTTLCTCQVPPHSMEDSHIQWFQPWFQPWFPGTSLSSSKGFRGDGSCFKA